MVLFTLQFNVQAQIKSLSAIKAQGAIKIDGDLSDAAWRTAPVIKDFVQNFPSYGLPASTNSEVKILYDNNAVYISAYLYDDPVLIRKQLTSRDGEQRQDVDYFSVFFDTYNDQQNGFQFLVTPENVQSDVKLDNNANYTFGDFGDRTWDAVWQSKTVLKDNGWVVEMRIPYTSLRFSKKEIQHWGLQFLRFTRRNNETSYWNPVDPNINGFINQFGKYTDLKNIQPPLRLSLSPYLTGGVRFNPEGSRKDKEWLRNGGMDVKWGINESFTLDVTLIPDFGQVVSDNVVNNLSPFEIRFQENRPFFTEGTELFNKSGLFYSRRVGNIPRGYYSVEALLDGNPDYDLIKNPSITQLYNGIKFSGRTKKKLGIGIFNAVTAPIEAKLRDISSGKDTIIRTEPLTNYNIIVLDQALKGRSSITFTNTNVVRNAAERDANVSAFDWSLFTKENKFRFQGSARYSKVFGFTPYRGAIHLIYDTITRDGALYIKPYDGFYTALRLGKVSGAFQYFIANNITANTYDPNDLGFLQTPNIINYTTGISYNRFRPTEKFVTYKYSFNANSKYLYKPYKFVELELTATAFWVFKNFWDVALTLSSLPYAQRDYFELRTPGRFVRKPAEVYFNINGSTDSRKRLFVSYFAGYAKRPDNPDNPYFRLDGGVRYRFSDQFTLSLNIDRQQEENQVGYAFLREPGGEPIIGHRKFTELVSVLSGVYNFTSRINLTLRTRHYWNKLGYNSFYNVDAEGFPLRRPFIAGQNENYNAFNLDAFLTWDFRLGSRVIFGWKNWLGDDYAFSLTPSGNKSYFNNLDGILDLPHGNELTLKFIYYLDYNQLRRKK